MCQRGVLRKVNPSGLLIILSKRVQPLQTQSNTSIPGGRNHPIQGICEARIRDGQREVASW